MSLLKNGQVNNFVIIVIIEKAIYNVLATL